MDEANLTALSSARWEEKYFPNAQLTKLEIELFQSDLEEMRRFLRAKGTFNSENEGWRYLLAVGHAYLQGQARLEPEDESGAPNPIGAEENLRRLVQIEAMYAVMKQRAYVWMKDNQVMEMQTNALRVRGDGYKIRCEDLEAEVTMLRAALAEIEAQRRDATIERPSTSPSAGGSMSTSKFKRLFKR